MRDASAHKPCSAFGAPSAAVDTSVRRPGSHPPSIVMRDKVKPAQRPLAFGRDSVRRDRKPTVRRLDTLRRVPFTRTTNDPAGRPHILSSAPCIERLTITTRETPIATNSHNSSTYRYHDDAFNVSRTSKWSVAAVSSFGSKRTRYPPRAQERPRHLEHISQARSLLVTPP